MGGVDSVDGIDGDRLGVESKDESKDGGSSSMKDNGNASAKNSAVHQTTKPQQEHEQREDKEQSHQQHSHQNDQPDQHDNVDLLPDTKSTVKDDDNIEDTFTVLDSQMTRHNQCQCTLLFTENEGEDQDDNDAWVQMN